MKVISLICQKGGTSKTTAAINLAVEATACGLEVALIDLDPQVSACDWRWCTCRTEHAMTPTPICYAMTRGRRTEFGRPAASIWFSTTTPTAASVCCAAKPRARNRGPMSAL